MRIIDMFNYYSLISTEIQTYYFTNNLRINCSEHRSNNVRVYIYYFSRCIYLFSVSEAPLAVILITTDHLCLNWP